MYNVHNLFTYNIYVILCVRYEIFTLIEQCVMILSSRGETVVPLKFSPPHILHTLMLLYYYST